MLKITIENSADVATFVLEGKLAGPWVDELERIWLALRHDSPNKLVMVDLCEVTFVDAEGRKLLTWMYEEGARFRTLGCMAKGIVEEIVRECSRSTGMPSVAR